MDHVISMDGDHMFYVHASTGHNNNFNFEPMPYFNKWLGTECILAKY